MIRDICLHGMVADRYEFFTTIVGPGVNTRFFYEPDQVDGGTCERFFSGGNEIRLEPDRLVHRGTGGAFCTYMHGVERPLKDAFKRDVRNRLVIYGVRTGDGEERLEFTNETDGGESYERIFRDGHILTNYFFFIAGDVQGGVKAAQEMILRLAGKFLKREDLDLDPTGRKVALDLYAEIGIPKWTLFLVRLDDTVAAAYAAAYRDAHRSGKALRAAERGALDRLAKEKGISWAQQERIEIRVAGEDPENADLVSRYEDVLIAHYATNLSERATLPKLNRLRALGMRRQLPGIVFDRLDKLLKRRRVDQANEPDYVTDVRRMLQSLFVDGASDQSEDLLVRLMHLKRRAVEERSQAFDDALAELARDAEGWRLQATNESAFEAFHGVLAHFDRYDTLWSIVNGVAFIDDYELTEDRLYNLARNRVIFENIKEGLFDELFFEPVIRNRYLNFYSRQRLARLQAGIAEIVRGDASPKGVIDSLTAINRHLALRRVIDRRLRELVRDIHRDPLDRQEQIFLRNTVNRMLAQSDLITEPVSEELFASVLLTIREECLYVNDLLPRVIAARDARLRDDFLENSGLDLFRIEELEQEYLVRENLPPTTLDFLNDGNKS